MNLDQFLSDEEKRLSKDFLENGFVIVPLKDGTIVEQLREVIFKFSMDYLKLPASTPINDFFDRTEKYVNFDVCNDLKLKLMQLTSQDGKYHGELYHSVKNYLDLIIGNEVCMQRSLNMSIQLPKDESALLPLHTDVWSGNSPYEVVFWLPLVNCFKTKSMYVLPIKKSREVFSNFARYEKLDAEALFQSLEKEMIFVDVPKGHAVIFSHSILHGNRVNIETETRWTYNIRFKSVLSPYGTKSLGETFIPINLKAATRIGHSNIIPQMN